MNDFLLGSKKDNKASISDLKAKVKKLEKELKKAKIVKYLGGGKKKDDDDYYKKKKKNKYKSQLHEDMSKSGSESDDDYNKRKKEILKLLLDKDFTP